MFLNSPVRLSFLVLFFFFAVALPAQTPPPRPANKTDMPVETCRLSGMVVAKADSAPLKGATVSLWPVGHGELEHTIATRSGADGRFQLKNVPPGNYHLGVFRNGYSAVQFGQRKTSDPGAILNLRPGQNMSDLLFKMPHSGVISGRIFDEDGEAMSHVTVEAFRYSYHDGRQELTQESETQSNDLGEFRLFGLEPGRYFISAQQQSWNQVHGEKEFSDAASAEEKGYPTIYYPNALEADKASPLNVKEGEEIPSIDFLMKEIQVY